MSGLLFRLFHLQVSNRGRSHSWHASLALAFLAIGAGVTLSGCGGSGTASLTGGTTTSGTTSVTTAAEYTLSGGSANPVGQTYTATDADTGGVVVSDSGVLSLLACTVTKSGDTSSLDNSSLYGLNAAILAKSGGALTTSNCTVSSSGNGANGVFATSSSTTATISGGAIKTTATFAHGIESTYGASITVKNVTIKTSGASSGGIATGRGGGTISVTGGSVSAMGADSAGVYSTGTVTASGATISSLLSDVVVVDGANSATFTDSTLTSSGGSSGMLVYYSGSGDASSGTGTLTLSGGSFSYANSSSPAFLVSNTTASINLTGVSVVNSSTTLLKAAASSWGTSGSNGGTVKFNASDETLTGDVIADSISSIALSLSNSSTLTGAIKSAALTLDSGSVWKVSGDSTLTTLSDSAGISGTSISNIQGNGYTVTYDSSLSGNSALGGKTYTLSGGGTLKPAS